MQSTTRMKALLGVHGCHQCASLHTLQMRSVQTQFCTPMGFLQTYSKVEEY